MAYIKQNFTDGNVLKAEQLIALEDAILAIEQSVDDVQNDYKRVESTDESNLLNLRDLESGIYILSGKFRPYNGSTATISFSTKLLATITTNNSNTQIQVFYPTDNRVQYFNITNSNYTQKNVYLNTLTDSVGNVGDLTTKEKANLVAAINEITVNHTKLSNEISAVDSSNSIVCNKEGSVITLSDSSERELVGLRIFGKTVQNATPSLEVPAPLESVGDDVQVTVCGKNLLPFPYSSKPATLNGVAFTVNDDGSVTANGTASASAVFSIVASSSKVVVLPKGKYFLSGCPSGGSTTTYCITLRTVDSSVSVQDTGNGASFVLPEAMAIHCTIYVAKNTTVDNLTFKPMLNIGASAVPFECEVAQNLSVSTPNGLHGIPVESDGNYTDENGQRWWCDTVNFETRKLERRTISAKLDGTHTIKAFQASGTTHHRIWFSIGDFVRVVGMMTSSLCSHLPYRSTDGVEGWFVTNPTDTSPFSNVALTLPDALAGTTKESVCAWLASNPITVVCARSDVQYEDLTDAELSQYSAIRTNYPNTTIFNDAGASMAVQYVADTKSYIEDKHSGGIVGAFSGTFDAAKEQIDTGIYLEAGKTYFIKKTKAEGTINLFIKGNSSVYRRMRAAYREAYFTPAISGNLVVYNPNGDLFDVALEVFEENSISVKLDDIPKVYTVGKTTQDYDYTSFTQCLLDLKDDYSPKVIYINEGDYDIHAEYKAANVPVYTGDDPTFDYPDYCVYIPPNTNVIGRGVVRLLWMPDPVSTGLTYNESITVAPVNCAGTMTLENVEIHCKNGRYCIHDDPLGAPEFTNAIKRYINVRCYKYENDSGFGWKPTIGFGVDRTMRYEFHNCVFKNTAGGRAFYMHTRNVVASTTLTKEMASNLVVSNCVMDTNGDQCVKFGNSAYNVGIRVDFNSCWFSGRIDCINESSSAENTYPNAWDLKLCLCNPVEINIADPDNLYPPVVYSY